MVVMRPLASLPTHYAPGGAQETARDTRDRVSDRLAPDGGRRSAQRREVAMVPRILARNAVEAAALAYIESLVPAAERIPAQGRHARRGRYFASGRPAFRRPAIA